MQIKDTCVVSVLKYKRSDDETSLMGKLNKFNIHSIRKKSDRLTSYFKILTGVEPQVLSGSKAEMSMFYLGKGIVMASLLTGER